MKKIITFVIAFFAIKNAFTQKKYELEPTLFNSRVEATNFDKRGLMGFAHFTSKTTVADFRVNMDGRGAYSASLGPVFSKHSHEKVRLSLMPGFSYSTNEKKLSYSGAFFFRAEEIGGKEMYFYIKGMKNFSGDRSKWIAEGDFFFNLGDIFKFGPSISIETEKYKELFQQTGEEIIKYDALFNYGARFLVKFLKSERIFISGFIGGENKTEDAKTKLSFFSHESSDFVIFEIGLQLSLK